MFSAVEFRQINYLLLPWSAKQNEQSIFGYKFLREAIYTERTDLNSTWFSLVQSKVCIIPIVSLVIKSKWNSENWNKNL